VRDLVAGPRRFVELQRVLPGISTEQLRSRLNRMVADGMLTRKRYREVPPRVDYELTDRARDLMPILGELARWGYEWAWSAPRAPESVDVGAIFRLAPGLVVLSPGTTGTVELRINEPDGQVASFTLEVTDGGVTIEERSANVPDALIAGDVADWVAAFAPDHDRGNLAITGDEKLADELLDGLTASSSSASVARASNAA
jgi:DNA-binding HxlR family transcriptional regulator